MSRETDEDAAMLRSVAAVIEKLGLTGLAEIGAGLEFRVWRAHHPIWGQVVLRAARRRFDSNDNDPIVDTGELLRREAGLARVLAATAIPVPTHVDLLHEEVDVAISEFIPTDDTSCSCVELGALTARLHNLGTADGLQIREDSTHVFRTTISERLSHRWSVLRAIEPALPKLPSPSELSALVPEGTAANLLHLDLRAANLLVRDGEIRALIDWSNSMVGDPALELARVAEYARLPENGIDYADFLHGYSTVRPLPVRSTACWELYRLDAAAMLAVVFNSESPEPVRGPEMLQWLIRRAQDKFSICRSPG